MQKLKDKSPFLSAVLTIALPIAFQNLLGTTASMVDTIMIGSEGELAVAAVGTCSQISSLFFSCYFGFASGALLFFSQYWGARDTRGINRTFGLATLFVLAVSLLFGGVAVLSPEAFLTLYTDKASIVAVGAPYLRIVGFSFPFLVVNVLMSFLLRSTGRVKPPLVASIAGLIVNFCLNYTLIYGNFGMPRLGAAGAAVGTLASTVVNFVLLLAFLLRSQSVMRFQLRELFDFRDGFVRIYFLKCIPILCNELFYGVGQMLINIVIGRQAEAAIAAMAAFRVLEGFVFAFFGGLADASSVLVGNQIGAGEHKEGYRSTWKFSLLCPAITLVICVVLCLVNQPLLGLFGLGAEALEYGKYMLLIYLAAGTVRTCNYLMNTCYRVGGETVFGTVLEISCLFLISVPATWLAGMVWHLPFLAVFAFVYTDELIRLVFELRYTYTGKWVKPVTDEGRAALPEFQAWLSARRKKA